MTLYPIAQFVDAVSDTANVLLDLNDETNWAVEFSGHGWDLPETSRQLLGGPLRDVPAVSGWTLGPRTGRLRIVARSAEPQALRRLARELVKPVSILRWQYDTQDAMGYFRCFPSPGYALDAFYDVAAGKSLAMPVVSLLTEPYLLRPRRDAIVSQTINNDPAHATNPLGVEVWNGQAVNPPNAGDVLTPAILTLIPSGDFYSSDMWIGLDDRNPALGLVTQAESAFATTGSNVADATLSNGNGVDLDDTETLTFRNLPRTSAGATSGADLRGRYRMLLVARHTAAGNTTYVQPRVRDVFGQMEQVILPTTTFAPGSQLSPQVINLGLVQVPPAQDPGTTGIDGGALSVYTPEIQLVIGKEAPITGTFRADYLFLMPADLRTAYVTVRTQTDPWTGFVGGSLVLDAARNVGYLVDSGSFAAGGVTVRGGLPKLDPHAYQRLYLLKQRHTVGGTVNADKGLSTAVSVAFNARHLFRPPPGLTWF